jgi:hypothetical protein
LLSISNIVTLLIVGFSAYIYLKKISILFVWRRYKHFVFTFFALIVAYFLIIEGLYYYENQYSIETGINSPLLELNSEEYHKWLLVLILMGYEKDVFPISAAAEFLAAVATYLGWLAIGGSIFFEYMSNLKIKKRMEGNQSISHQNHYVICGWNLRTPEFISNTIKAITDFTNKSCRIVIINNDLKDVLSTNPNLKMLIETGQVDYVKGKTRDVVTLEKANIHKAASIVLFADGLNVDADERTLLRSLAISRFCRLKNSKKNGTTKDSIYIIAEVNDRQFEPSLIASDVNEVICTTEIGNNIIIQTMNTKGLSMVLQDLLSYSDDNNEFYTIDLLEHKSLVGFTYDELLPKLRKYNIQLIGIKSVFYDETQNPPEEIIDATEILELLKTEKQLKRQFIVNPSSQNQEEYNYKTDNDDQLIVLCENGKIIKTIP